MFQHVLGPSESVIAVEVVCPLDLGAGSDQESNALDRSEGGREVQRPAALVGAGVGISAVLQ